MTLSKYLSANSDSIWLVVRFLLLLAFMAVGESLTGEMYLAAFVFFALYVIIVPLLPRRRPKADYSKYASYRLFSRMKIFATLALDLGVMVGFYQIFCSSMSASQMFIALGIWLLIIATVLLVYPLITRRHWPGLALREFLVGAIIWIAGDVLMLNTGSVFWSIVWTVVWGIGIVLIFHSIADFRKDFEAVGVLEGVSGAAEEERRSNAETSRRAVIASSGIMMLIMGLCAFYMTDAGVLEVPRALHIVFVHLPVVFMMIAFYYALRQPLDRRRRLKLLSFVESSDMPAPVRENLHSALVESYRTRWGIKIAQMILRPFFRLKSSGLENLRPSDYPSVFVFNHGVMDGPLGAVIYLPTYFRPWIHDEMLDFDKAYESMKFTFAGFYRTFGKHIGTFIVWCMAHITHWALNSLDPIPVVRGNSREVMSTFEESLKALEEGDNIIIFPEKPGDRTPDGAESGTKTEDLRTFYTGFAHIGKMYYDRCGKELLFYPAVANIKLRAFRIGKPVKYDSTLSPRESKIALANALHEQVEALSAE